MVPVALNQRAGTAPLYLWPELAKHLLDRYEVLYSIDFFECDRNMEQLHKELSAFRGHEFSESQRLVFACYDTEYYLPGMKLGFNTENLIRILEDLDISLGYCIFLTNHHGITGAINQRCGEFPMRVVENDFSVLLATPDPVILERHSDQIKKTFCFMSNVRRDHRSYVRLWIQEQGLMDHVMMSWSSGKQTKHYISTDGKTRTNTDPYAGCELVYPHPFTRVRDKIPHSPVLTDLYHQYHWALDVDHRDEAIGFGPNQNNLEAPWLAETFLNIVAETAFDYPYPFLTEKTFKCFWHRSPFVIVGPAHSLAHLKSQGFQTFDQWFDESYDSVTDPVERLQKVLATLTSISKWSLSQCQDVYNSMKPVLDHNLRHYQTHFCRHLLDEAKKNI